MQQPALSNVTTFLLYNLGIYYLLQKYIDLYCKGRGLDEEQLTLGRQLYLSTNQPGQLGFKAVLGDFPVPEQ